MPRSQPDASKTPGKDRRRVPRVRVRAGGLLGPGGREFPIIELSTQGLSFNTLRQEFTPGQLLTAELQVGGRTLADSVRLQVVRVDREQVGCAFHELEPDQQHDLFEYVLHSMNRDMVARLTLNPM